MQDRSPNGPFGKRSLQLLHRIPVARFRNHQLGHSDVIHHGYARLTERYMPLLTGERNRAKFLLMKFLKVLVNSLLSGLFFSGLLALLIMDLNVDLEFDLLLLGQLTLFNAVVYGVVMAFLCIVLFFIIQFISGRNFKIKLISPSFLMISFSLILILFLVVLRENMRHFNTFFTTEIESLLQTQFFVLIIVGILGILFLWGYLYAKKNVIFLLIYFISLAAAIVYAVHLRTIFPPTPTHEKMARLEAKEITKRITIIGMQGLSFDFIIPLVNEGKLPNFAWLMERGSWGQLTNFSPNDPIILNASFNTGKLPAKHLQLSPTKYQMRQIDKEIGVVPRFILYRQIEKLGILQSSPRAPIQRLKDIWKIFGDNKITYLKEDRPYCTHVENPSESTESLFNRFYKDYKFESSTILESLQHALLSDISCEEKFTQIKNELQPQLSYLLLSGLNLTESYFYKYNFPDLFGDIDQEELAKYSTVIENYHRLYDQIIGKHLAAMKEDELLVVYSPHGIEPLPIWKRMVHWIFGDKDISAYHENGPEGVIFFYGKDIIRGKHIEEMRLIDIAPTLLNYLELPVGKDMDGIVNSTMFLEDFKIENPVLYITSYEEVEIKAPEE
jgi:hypothetical protein